MTNPLRRTSEESLAEFDEIDEVGVAPDPTIVPQIAAAKLILLRMAIIPKNEEIIRAFKNKQPMKGRAFSTDGNSFKLFGNTIARHKGRGLEVSNAGFPTKKTYETLRDLGVKTQIKKGTTFINGKQVNPSSKAFHFVPNKDISAEKVFVNPSKAQKNKTSNTSIIKQRKIRELSREQATGSKKDIPLSSTQIQPSDQREINKITGVKTPISNPILAPDSHHIFFKKNIPKLSQNLNNIIPQERNEHVELHRLNTARLQLLKMAGFDFKTNPRESISGRRKTLENKGIKLDRRIPTSNIGRSNIILPSGEQRALDKFVRSGEKVDPRRQPFGDKIKPSLKKKLAKGLNCSPCALLGMSKLTAELNIKQLKYGALHRRKTDEIIENFNSSGLDVTGANGVFDPTNKKVLDATDQGDIQRIRQLYGGEGETIGFNSFTDTRKGPNNNINLVRKQLEGIEARGGIPSLGFDEGSLEAVDITKGKTDRDVVGKLANTQRSTGVLDNNNKFRVVVNPKFQK